MRSPCRPLPSPQAAARTETAVRGSSEADPVVQTDFAKRAVVLGTAALLMVLAVFHTRVALSILAVVFGMMAILVVPAAPQIEGMGLAERMVLVNPKMALQVLQQPCRQQLDPPRHL